MNPDFALGRPFTRVLLVGLLVGLLVVGCASTPVSRNGGVGAASQEDAIHTIEAIPGGVQHTVDAQRSWVHILVFRAGRASALGHNHVLTVPHLRGRLWTPEHGLAGARFALGFRLDQLQLDPPDLRASLGPGWATVLTPEEVAATRQHMLGPDNLQAAVYPWARLRSLQLVGEAPHLAAELEIELHGQIRRQWVALEVRPGGPGWSVQGSLVLRQSDFGIQPYSVLGGLLAVQDEMVIEFGLRLAGQ